MVACEGGKRAVQLLLCARSLGLTIRSPVPILEDNMATIALSMKPSLNSGRSRHMDVRWHWLQQMHLERKLRLHFIPTEWQVADLFTKNACAPVHARLQPMLMGTVSLVSGAVSHALHKLASILDYKTNDVGKPSVELADGTEASAEFAEAMFAFQYEKANVLSSQDDLDLALDIIEILDAHAPAVRWEASRKEAMMGALKKLLKMEPLLAQRHDIAIAAAKELVQMKDMYQTWMKADTAILESCLEHLHTAPPFRAQDVFAFVQTFDAESATPLSGAETQAVDVVAEHTPGPDCAGGPDGINADVASTASQQSEPRSPPLASPPLASRRRLLLTTPPPLDRKRQCRSYETDTAELQAALSERDHLSPKTPPLSGLPLGPSPSAAVPRGIAKEAQTQVRPSASEAKTQTTPSTVLTPTTSRTPIATPASEAKTQATPEVRAGYTLTTIYMLPSPIITPEQRAKAAEDDRQYRRKQQSQQNQHNIEQEIRYANAGHPWPFTTPGLRRYEQLQGGLGRWPDYGSLGPCPAVILGGQPRAKFWNVDETDAVTHFQERAASVPLTAHKVTSFQYLPEFDNLLVGVTMVLTKRGRKFHHLASRCLRNKGQQAFEASVHIVWIAAAHAHGYTMCGNPACRRKFTMVQGLRWARAR